MTLQRFQLGLLAVAATTSAIAGAATIKWVARWLREADDELDDELTAELERIGRTQPPYPLPGRPGRHRPTHLRPVNDTLRRALEEDR